MANQIMSRYVDRRGESISGNLNHLGPGYVFLSFRVAAISPGTAFQGAHRLGLISRRRNNTN